MGQSQMILFWVIVGLFIAALFILFGKEILFNLIGTEVTLNG